MKNRVLWALVVVLGIGCVVEGVALASRHETPVKPPGVSRPSDLASWQQRVLADLRRDLPRTDRDFDRVFDDGFFRHAVDPFAEIDRVRQRLLSELSGAERKTFADAFDGWFGRRIALADVSTDVKDGAKRVEVDFRIPGLRPDSVNVDVNTSRIRLSYSAEKSETRGKETLGEAEAFEKVVPIPADADPSGFQVAKKGDELSLVFHKRGPRPAA